MTEEILAEERPIATYAQPLSRLQVSWGAVLAGAVSLLATTLILWALCLAIILSATHASVDSLRGAVIAAGVCAILTTLIGGFVGGAVAGYLPGNPRRLVTVLHGLLAWALMFLASAAIHAAILGGAAQLAASAVVTTTGAAVASAGAAVGGAASGAAPLDQKTVTLLESLGYTPAEATAMVTSARRDLQRVLRGQAPEAQAQASQAGEQVRGALDTLLGWSATYLWLWFATWAVAGGLAALGATMILPRVRRVPERELELGGGPIHVVTREHAVVAR